MKRPQSTGQALYELLSSMRFAVSLLTVLSIASVVGTVLKQNEPYANYVVQFGQFWFELFRWLGLYDVYTAAWFIAVLAFLVCSTSTCIVRNGPAMLREMRAWREGAREASLRHLPHHRELPLGRDVTDAIARVETTLTDSHFRFRSVRDPAAGTVLIAAKAGSYHRLGYFFTHGAIVLICIGGLIDGNLPLKLKTVLGQKTIETRDIPQGEVPPQSRLSADNLAFRGNVPIPEGGAADVVFVNVADGYMVQELPFVIRLERFHIEHYSTGQPKDFASDLEITDKITGERFTHTIRVNKPLVHRGIAIYQASFDDGGTRMRLRGWPLFAPQDAPFEFDGTMREAVRLSAGDLRYNAEFSGFRAFNVEAMGTPEDTRVETASVTRKMLERLDAGTDVVAKRTMRNVGPSFQYKLRDEQGQAREYHNYMLPIELEGRWYLVSGMRETPNENFRYLRFPIDGDGSLEGYMGLRAALFDAPTRAETARRYAITALGEDQARSAMGERLQESTLKVLEMFTSRGFESVAEFLKRAVPEAEQDKAAQIYLKILEGAAFEAYRIARARAGRPLAEADAETFRFLQDSLNAISDSFHYGAPLYLQLLQYDEVKASGLQLTRSPGRNIVYGGSLLLVIGIFAMLYVRERRLWLLVKPGTDTVLVAMTTNRPMLTFEEEFQEQCRRLTLAVGPVREAGAAGAHQPE